ILGILRAQRGDADQAPLHIDEGATTIARIDGGARLDEATQQRTALRFASLPINRADDAERGRLLQAEWTAHRDCEFPDPNRPRVADDNWLQVSELNPQHREILCGRHANDLRRDSLARCERDAVLCKAGYDVVIGHDIAIGT